jgi:hypothetical protein
MEQTNSKGNSIEKRGEQTDRRERKYGKKKVETRGTGSIERNDRCKCEKMIGATGKKIGENKHSQLC